MKIHLCPVFMIHHQASISNSAEKKRFDIPETPLEKQRNTCKNVSETRENGSWQSDLLRKTDTDLRS